MDKESGPNNVNDERQMAAGKERDFKEIPDSTGLLRYLLSKGPHAGSEGANDSESDGIPKKVNTRVKHSSTPMEKNNSVPSAESEAYSEALVNLPSFNQYSLQYEEVNNNERKGGTAKSYFSMPVSQRTLRAYRKAKEPYLELLAPEKNSLDEIEYSISSLLRSSISIERVHSKETSIPQIEDIDENLLCTTDLPLETLTENFTPFGEYVDKNGTSHNLIKKLELLDMSLQKNGTLYRSSNFVLILVESRLLQDWRSTSQKEREIYNIQPSLNVLCNDLEKEGFIPRVIKADLYSGPTNIDGKVILAVRSFFQDLVKYYYNFSGTILVGSFPEARIIRRFARLQKADAKSIKDGKIVSEKKLDLGDHWVDILTEELATSSDIVLADLLGNWEDVYEEGPKSYAEISAVMGTNYSLWSSDFPLPGSAGLVENVPPGSISGTLNKKAYYSENTTPPVNDFFFLNDSKYKLHKIGSGTNQLSVIIEIDSDYDKEINSTLRKSLPNPTSLPSFSVSRIDARKIAIDPHIPYQGIHGYSLVENNKPHFLVDKQPSPIVTQWVLDALRFRPDKPISCVRNQRLERLLIKDYLARNHSYRSKNGIASNIIRRASVIGADGWVPRDVGKTLTNSLFPYAIPPGTVPQKSDQEFDLVYNATIQEFITFLKKPALLKGVWTHGNQYGIYLDALKKKDGFIDVDKALGGSPWNWIFMDYDVSGMKAIHNEASSLIPTFKDNQHSKIDQIQDATVNFFRTIKENELLSSQGGSFYFMYCCLTSTPSRSNTYSYSSPAYGLGQPSDCLLFYAKGLAVISKSESVNHFAINYDHPIKGQRPFGDIWRHNFSMLSLEQLQYKGKKTGSEYNPWAIERRKLSYCYCISGDWTLKINYLPKR